MNASAIHLLADVAAQVWESEHGQVLPPLSSAEESAPQKKSGVEFPTTTDNDENVNPRGERADGPYWMQANWVPINSCGSQVTPEEIRAQLQSFIATSTFTKTTILNAMGVNSNSFRKFMTNEYKDPWRAAENGTYWAAARMFEAHLHEKKPSMESHAYSRQQRGYRTTAAETVDPTPLNQRLGSTTKKPTALAASSNHKSNLLFPRGRRSKESSFLFVVHVRSILATEIQTHTMNRCCAREVAAMVRAFLRDSKPGSSQAALCRELGVARRSLHSFLLNPTKHCAMFHQASIFIDKKLAFENREHSS